MDNQTLKILTSIADIGVSIAYFAIPAELYYFYKKLLLTDKGFPKVFEKVLYLFVLFIVLCGFTHSIMSVYAYHPMPLLNCVMKILTAMISLYTAKALLNVIPRILIYPIYTKEIEHENLERRLHEHYLQENINIFRQIREYTQALNKRQGDIRDLYEEVVNLLYKQLKVEVAIFTYHQDDECVMIRKAPDDLNCPSVISFSNPNSISDKLTESWWFVYFDSGNVHHKGYVALKMSPKNVRIVTRKNLVLGPFFKQTDNEEDREDHLGESTSLFPMVPETETESVMDLLEKSYFGDIILDIVEHFESNLLQWSIREENMNLIKELTDKNEALVNARKEG